MGGYGSGRWGAHTKRAVVEECLVLDIDDLARRHVLARHQLWHRLGWHDAATGRETASLEVCATSDEGGRTALLLRYAEHRPGRRDEVHEWVPLQATRPRFGGVRWWLTCPLAVGGRPCNRRVRKLYYPPGRRYFGCRHCHRLTYRSCQESHVYDRLAAQLARRFPGALAP
ncbi:MAG: hypothetical protein M3Q65_23040 [Chloroflexota bacterium]|nr:hypothetical protein [Chloroflexota bacterium]